MINRKIILVDKNDRAIGREEKIKTHQQGKLHRAFSVFIFNDKNELLLQKRALAKYHTPGLWTNTCCSHPFSKSIKKDAQLRLKAEMGFSCPLIKIFDFKYKTKFNNNLIENEYDHVFAGRFNKKPKINPQEVDNFKWISLNILALDIKINPKIYTPWLKIIVTKYLKNLWRYLKSSPLS